MLNPYKVLEVDREAEQEVIEAAYKRLAGKYHPDRDPSPSATAKMQGINAAYEILRDPARRRHHDRQADSRQPRPEGSPPEHGPPSAPSPGSVASRPAYREYPSRSIEVPGEQLPEESNRQPQAHSRPLVGLGCGTLLFLIAMGGIAIYLPVLENQKQETTRRIRASAAVTAHAPGTDLAPKGSATAPDGGVYVRNPLTSEIDVVPPEQAADMIYSSGFASVSVADADAFEAQRVRDADSASMRWNLFLCAGAVTAALWAVFALRLVARGRQR